MNELKFSSQVCTTIEQSKKLLELGLKPETADMKHIPYSIYAVQKHYDDGFGFEDKCYLPAWSLHRLMELNSVSIMEGDVIVLSYDNTYDDIIEDIEWAINKGYFNKEYLNK